MAKKRRQSPGEAHEHSRIIREGSAPTIEQEFPIVAEIRLRVTFEDVDEKKGPEPWSLRYAPAQKAFFEHRCPYWECVMGGFSFAPAVYSAVQSRKDSISGTERCQGWQDIERMYKHGCRLKAHYEIEIAYRSAV